VPASDCGVNVGRGGGGGGGGGAIARKRACTCLAVRSQTVQRGLICERQPPDQPANRQPARGLARSATDLPFATTSLHFGGHAIPRGVLVTVPRPTTFTLNASVAAAPAATAAVPATTSAATPARRRTSRA
jgi:hypothetical protein